jgi:hypothetical protein
MSRASTAHNNVSKSVAKIGKTNKEAVKSPGPDAEEAGVGSSPSAKFTAAAPNDGHLVLPGAGDDNSARRPSKSELQRVLHEKHQHQHEVDRLFQEKQDQTALLEAEKACLTHAVERSKQAVEELKREVEEAERKYIESKEEALMDYQRELESINVIKDASKGLIERAKVRHEAASEKLSTLQKELAALRERVKSFERGMEEKRNGRLQEIEAMRASKEEREKSALRREQAALDQVAELRTKIAEAEAAGAGRWQQKASASSASLGGGPPPKKSASSASLQGKSAKRFETPPTVPDDSIGANPILPTVAEAPAAEARGPSKRGSLVEFFTGGNAPPVSKRASTNSEAPGNSSSFNGDKAPREGKRKSMFNPLTSMMQALAGRGSGRGSRQEEVEAFNPSLDPVATHSSDESVRTRTPDGVTNFSMASSMESKRSVGSQNLSPVNRSAPSKDRESGRGGGDMSPTLRSSNDMTVSATLRSSNGVEGTRSGGSTRGSTKNSMSLGVRRFFSTKSTNSRGSNTSAVGRTPSDGSEQPVTSSASGRFFSEVKNVFSGGRKRSKTSSPAPRG